jgi:hypothetical protein
MSKFVISKRTNDEYQFNLKAQNGQANYYQPGVHNKSLLREWD